MTTQNIKEKLNEYIEKPQKKESNRKLETKSPLSQTINPVEGQYSRLEKWKTESQGPKIK
jgi:hypothetical protein